MLQPMVLSLSLEALVDRRTVQQVCQQAQLRKLGQAAKLLQSVQVRSRERARRARAHTPPHHAAAPTPPRPRPRARHAGRRSTTTPHHAAVTPLQCRAHRTAYPTPRPDPVVQAQARLRDARRAAGLDERIVQARPSLLSPDTTVVLED